MKIIEVAREQRDLLNEGIAYIALWQQTTANGKRSWFTEDFFPVDSKEEEPVFDAEQKTRLAEIANIDGDAVLLNGYYHAWIGSADEPLNATDISVGLKKHYEQHNAIVSGYLVEGEPAPAFEDLKMDGREELGFGRTRSDPVGEDGMQASDVPESITIEVPFTSCGDLALAKENLAALLQSKATLTNAALGEDAYWYAPPDEYSPENPGGWYGPAPADNTLPIEFTDSTVKFEWIKFGADSEVIQAWSAFLCAAVKFAKKAKRVTAKDGAVENQKFHFRAFMVRLGMNDAENKTHRKLLLRNLTGDAAFATAESKERWQAKHLKKAEVTDGE